MNSKSDAQLLRQYAEQGTEAAFTEIVARRNFSLTINPATPTPSLGQPSKSGTQFRFFISASSGQNYTIQVSTNLNSTNWISLLVTNPPFNTFQVTDPNATTPIRFYRVLQGP